MVLMLLAIIMAIAFAASLWTLYRIYKENNRNSIEAPKKPGYIAWVISGAITIAGIALAIWLISVLGGELNFNFSFSNITWESVGNLLLNLLMVVVMLLSVLKIVLAISVSWTIVLVIYCNYCLKHKYRLKTRHTVGLILLNIADAIALAMALISFLGSLGA